MNASDLHVDAAWWIVGIFALTGVWALAAHRFEVLRGRALTAATVAAWVGIGLHVTIGAIALQNEGAEASNTHVFYGFLTIISIAILTSYRSQLPEWRYVLTGLGNLWIMGLALRALTLPAA